jgi:hypothetical protein
MAMVIPEEISMIVSSDPSQGASNVSADGSYFEVQLQDGLKIPKDALNVNVSVEESSIWWVIPNIITGTNDKMYFNGSSKGSTVTNAVMGFNPLNTFSLTNGFLEILKGSTVDPLPVGSFIVGDTFQIDTGSLAGFAFEILSIINDSTSVMSYNVTPSNVTQGGGLNDFTRIRAAGPTQAFTIAIPQGLYDLAGLNQAIARELETAGARSSPDPLVTLNPDEATQKVEMRFNYADVTVDFTQPDTFANILGFANAIYGPYPTAPLSVLAPSIASFNKVNYFLIHSDLTTTGIRFNNKYNQTIGQVLIDVPPGSQIVSTPNNPAKINAPELTGARRSNLRFWLTDDTDNRVNTNSEYWSARIVIHYLRPHIVREQ